MSYLHSSYFFLLLLPFRGLDFDQLRGLVKTKLDADFQIAITQLPAPPLSEEIRECLINLPMNLSRPKNGGF